MSYGQVVGCGLSSNVGIVPDHCAEKQSWVVAQSFRFTSLLFTIYIPTLTDGHEIWVVTERIWLLKWDFSWKRLDSALEILWGAWTSRGKSWWLGYLITMLPWHRLLDVFRVHLSKRETLDRPMSLKRKYMPYIYLAYRIICAFCLRNALGIVYPVYPNWPTAAENHSWRCWMDR